MNTIMNKKRYKQPAMKAILVDTTEMICESIVSMRVYRKEVIEWEEAEELKPKGWGEQW